MSKTDMNDARILDNIIEKTFQKLKEKDLPLLVASDVTYSAFHNSEAKLTSGTFDQGKVWLNEMPSPVHGCVAGEFHENLVVAARQLIGKSFYETEDGDIVVSANHQRAFRPDGSYRPHGANLATTATIVVEHALFESLAAVLNKVRGYFAGTTPTDVQEAYVFKTWREPLVAVGVRDWGMLCLKYTRAQWIANAGAELANPVYAVNYSPGPLNGPRANETAFLTTPINGVVGGCNANGIPMYQLHVRASDLYNTAPALPPLLVQPVAPAPIARIPPNHDFLIDLRSVQLALQAVPLG